MDRQDKEALFMIIERNGIGTTLKMIDAIKELFLEDDTESAIENFLGNNHKNCKTLGVCLCK